MAGDPGPLARIRDDELVWLTPSPPLRGIVESDLAVLEGADRQLLRAADAVAHSGLEDGQGLLADLLSAAVSSYGELDGLSATGELDTANRGAAQFDTDLDERDGTLKP